ncbi:glycosyltransferase [Campylobacter sp. 2018MI13]|uniref:glycosyltransferase n=1 Tax=Campylobacter sp. 2018MI13 TaxID=2836737 RepID=UPI001BD9BF20|nr:glycosyltransferase [Campylobacter sp. 2018MI13]MBT0882102.1 glycosyltransferase family 2 protein [Campylobacter sp. 2018MI13]
MLILTEEFDKIFNKINKNENFALLRYGDGERAIINNIRVKAQEGWEVNNNLKFSNSLYETLKLNNPKIIHAISCPCCDFASSYFYQQQIDNTNISLSNIFVNINHKRFKEYFEKIKKDAVVIANYRAKNKKIGNLNILKYYEISDDCNDFYNKHLNNLIDEIINDFGTQKNLLYVISAGPLAEIIIHKLFENNEENQYIDFGSSIDFYFKDKIQLRPYMDNSSEYANKNCKMKIYNKKELEISVVLNLYKRPHVLPLQIESIKKQSIKPKEILIYQDGVFEGVQMCKEAKEIATNIEISKENKGVWQRFKFAQKATSKYICVFDDDTLPGCDFLANCLNEMHKQEGLYGAIGVVMKKPRDYPENIFRLGWACPNEITALVDFVGHAWFFKKEWLQYLLNAPQEMQDLKVAGEDIAFSLMLQKQNIQTFVPPHNKNNKKIWGANPELSIKYGIEKCGISMSDDNIKKFNKAINLAMDNGFTPLINNTDNFNKTLSIFNQSIKNRDSYLKRLERVIRHYIKRKLGIKKYQ